MSINEIAWMTDTAQGLVVQIYVQPRASRNRIVGPHGDALKIQLTAPPVDGEANRMCIKFLAKQLQLPKSAIEIIGGTTNRTKRVLLKFDKTRDQRQRKSECISYLMQFGK